MKKITTLLLNLWTHTLKLFAPLVSWWQRVVSPMLTKIGYGLRHNVLYKEIGNDVV